MTKAKMSYREACQVLEMAEGLPLAAVKDQYRRLAKIWHPDKNDSSEATERMVRINVAYEVLYLFLTKSHTGFTMTGSRNAEADETMDAKRGRDIARKVKITLFESVFGCKINVEGEVNDICVTCGGWGREGLSHTCVLCNGRGVYFNLTRNMTSTRCTECQGNGFVQSSCHACSGSGQGATRMWSHQVKVPAGVRHGEVLRIEGMGARSLNKQLNGDLVVTVEIVEHPLFHKGDRGLGFGFDDLVVMVPVSYETWIVGGEVVVPLLNGSRLVTFTAESYYLHILGEGLTSLKDRSKRGRLIIKLQPVTDKKLGIKARREIEHMAEGKQTSDLKRWSEEMHAWTLGSTVSRFGTAERT